MVTLKDTILSLNQAKIYHLYLDIDQSLIEWSTLYNCNKIVNCHRGESDASMSFRWFGNKLICRDFGDARYNGDIFKVVGYILSKNYTDALEFVEICNDILEVYYSDKCKKHNKQEDYEIIERDKTITTIDTKLRTLQKRDYQYFNTYGILNRYVDKYVEAVMRYSINGKITGYKNAYTDPCYKYIVNNTFVKLYFPNRNKKSKYPRFITNNILQFEDLNEIRQCNDIIIVKSIKDKMLLIQMLDSFNITNIIVLTASSETTSFDYRIIEILHKFCKHNIYVIFDVDSTGLISMKILQETYNFLPLLFSTDAKDPTDFVKAFGYTNAVTLFRNHLKTIIDNRLNK